MLVQLRPTLCCLYACLRRDYEYIKVYSFMETPRKFNITKLSIRKLGFSSVHLLTQMTDEDLSLQIASFAILI